MENTQEVVSESVNELPETEVAKETVVETAPEVKEEAVVEAPAYSPNFKVTAYGKEYEIPEKFRSLIKDADSEKEIASIFNKYYAFDNVKEKNENLKSTAEKFENLSTSINKLDKYLKNNDYDSFFDTLKISEEQIQQWMLQKLKMKDLPPEEQAVYNKKSEYQKMLYEKEQEADFYKTQYESYQEQMRVREVSQVHSKLDQLIGEGTVSQIAKSFDAKQNRAGAFKEEVIKRAFLVEKTTGREMTPEEAVQEAVRLYGWNMQNQATPQETVLAPKQSTSKPSLPTLQGKNSSPVTKKITSLDDLKKIRAQIIKDEVSKQYE